MVQPKRVSVTVVSVPFFMAFLFLLVINHSIFAKEQMPKETIKTVTLKKEPVGITPNPLEVKLGTTIVWFNSDKGSITIKFTDKLGIACKVPVNFYGDLMGYYESRIIPEGGTASICFVYKGEYNYEVRRLIDKGKAKPVEQISPGKIVAFE